MNKLYIFNNLVSRAGLEPATTALKVRRRFTCVLLHAGNTGVFWLHWCTDLHRMLAFRYQSRCQTNKRTRGLVHAPNTSPKP